MKKTLLAFVAVALVASAAPAFAGQSYTGGPGSTVNTPLVIAQESFDGSNDFEIPGTTQVSRKLSIVPSSTLNFILELNVGSLLTKTTPQPGVTFDPAPTFGGVTLSLDAASAPCVLSNVTLPVASATQFRWQFNITGCEAQTTAVFPTVTVTFNNAGNYLDIIDARADNLQDGYSIWAELILKDQATLQTFPSDQGGEAFEFIKAAWGSFAKNLVATTATIDVNEERKLFVAEAGDSQTEDFGASFEIGAIGTYYDWGAPRGIFWNPNNGYTEGFFTVTFTSSDRDFSDFATGYPMTTPPNKTSSGGLTERKIFFGNPQSAAGGIKNIISMIEGDEEQASGSFQLTITYSNGHCTNAGTGCVEDPIRTFFPGATYTTWDLNGTVLFAPMVNGNDAAFKSRFYVCAPKSKILGDYYAFRITTLPVDGTASMSYPALGDPAYKVSNWIIEQGGCTLIKLEDLLDMVNIARPYIDNGGNLAVELTFPVPDAVGIHQSTNKASETSFVTAPMVRLNRGFTLFGMKGQIEPGL